MLCCLARAWCSQASSVFLYTQSVAPTNTIHLDKSANHLRVVLTGALSRAHLYSVTTRDTMPKIDKYGLPDDTPDSWVEAVGRATFLGYGFGSIVGTMHASWSDVPSALRDQAWPGLKRTAQIMNHWGITFATVGASYAAAKVC